MAKILNLRIKLEKQSWVYKADAREKILKIIAEKGTFTAEDKKSIPCIDTYTSMLDFMYSDHRLALDELCIEGDIYGGDSCNSEKDALIRGLENLLKHLKGYK